MTTPNKLDALTNLILEVFRTNGRLIAAGDALVAPVGLTSARWQVMGAIAFSDGPKTVAQLARAMGLTRQSVQRIVNELAQANFVQLVENPDHKRAKRIIFTKSGTVLFAAASKRQRPWAMALARNLDANDIDRSSALLRALQIRLEADSRKERDR
jgi:DNA-binding MarR family transcriptional regulator